MLGLLFILLGTSAHAGEPSLTVTIERKDQYVPWDERHIGQLSLVVHFRVDSDQTADIEVECNFRVPKKGMNTRHISQGYVLTGQPTYGRFRQWVPNGGLYGEDDWEVECGARPR